MGLLSGDFAADKAILLYAKRFKIIKLQTKIKKFLLSIAIVLKFGKEFAVQIQMSVETTTNFFNKSNSPASTHVVQVRERQGGAPQPA